LSTPVTTRKALSRGIMKSQYESTRRPAINKLLNAIIGRQGSNMCFVFLWIFCFTDLQSVPPNPSTPWYTVVCNQRVQIISSKFVNILTNNLLTNSSKYITSMFRNLKQLKAGRTKICKQVHHLNSESQIKKRHSTNE